MIKYAMTTAALKVFSASPQTKRVYRMLGNQVGQRRRVHAGLSEPYLERAKRLLALCDRLHATEPGYRLLEIGTGWVHWESTILALFNEVRVTLLDVWDNRQLQAYKRYMAQLDDALSGEFGAVGPARLERAHRLLQAIAAADSFEEIYQVLGFTYVISPDGTLSRFADESFDLIFSCNVLEHIDRGILPGFVQDFYRLLKPGGYSIHQIDLGDHISYYDPGVCLKNYLRYSDVVWTQWFQNDVQYFNRVQKPEWQKLYRDAGFVTVEEESIPTDITRIKVAPLYANLSHDDLECLTLRVVHQRPTTV